jgi:hypothetical protein
VTGAARDARDVAVGLGAPLVAAAGFLLFLGHRSDYVGHFLAGFGATLGALGLVLEVPAARGARGPWLVLGTVALCLAAGAALEASVFRIARFDPVDLGHQSLGAAVAGAAALVATREGAPSPAVRSAGAVAAIAATLAGFWYAFS